MRNPTQDDALDYIAALFAPEEAWLSSARNFLPESQRGMQLGPVEAKILQLLIHMNQVKTIVEVGTCLGVSAVWMARALPANGTLYTLEKNPQHAAYAKETLEKANISARTEVLVGDAQENLKTLSAKAPFDMVFIDADKAAYPAYLDWAEAHVRQGGLIIGDNTLLFGAAPQPTCPAGTNEKSWQAMRKFNARLADPLKYQSILLPTPEGMTVAIKLF